MAVAKTRIAKLERIKVLVDKTLSLGMPRSFLTFGVAYILCRYCEEYKYVIRLVFSLGFVG